MFRPLVAVFVVWIGFDSEGAFAEAPKGRLFFLGVAYDAAPPEGKTIDHYNYAPDNFSDLLGAQSAPLFGEVGVASMKGAEATRVGVLKKLQALRSQLRKDDLLFFYWGTHGGVDPRYGWNASLADEGILYSFDIKRELGKFPCRVIAIVSTCGSGGFARKVSRVDERLPKNVAVLCACRPKQSTGNELDVSLCEALAGFADFDGDGMVTLREAVSYVPARYRAWHTGGGEDEANETGDDQHPVIVARDPALLDLPLAKTRGEYAAVVKDGRWYGVSIVARNNDKTRVRFLGFDRTCPDGSYSLLDESFADEFLDLPGGEPPIEVEWQGRWWPARIVERSDENFRIHYINFPESDDETVPASRVRFPFPTRESAALRK
jgi:hypothetical protein